MNDTERLAMAAHLHVALRRKVGRVTDTEWMASNPEYGLAMVDLALKHAEAHMDQELGRLALRFGAALTLGGGRTSGSPAAVPTAHSLADGKDTGPWWDSNFSPTRSAKASATHKSVDTHMPSAWPVSAAGALGNAKDAGDAPMPLRRGRYVGGLR